MDKYIDKKMVFSAAAASVVVVVGAMLVNAFLPNSLPGAAIVKSVADKAAS